MASDYNARRIEAEITLQSLLTAVDGLQRIARSDPAAIRALAIELAAAAGEISLLLASVRERAAA